MATKTCTHIKVTGARCGSPALYGEQFCYFHQHAHRGVCKPPQSRLHPIAMIEDEESIQASLMEVINALMRNTIDLKRAELILRALHIAVKNARRAKFSNQHDAVREIPQYAEPAPAPEPPRPRYRTKEELRIEKEKQLAEYFGVPYDPTKPIQIPSQAEMDRKEAATSGKAHVGTAAPGCPGGPEVPVRSAVDPKPIAAHDFKKPTTAVVKTQQHPEAPQKKRAQPSTKATIQNEAPPRKPSASVTQAPKERKSAAHRASGG